MWCISHTPTSKWNIQNIPSIIPEHWTDWCEISGLHAHRNDYLVFLSHCGVHRSVSHSGGCACQTMYLWVALDAERRPIYSVHFVWLLSYVWTELCCLRIRRQFCKFNADLNSKWNVHQKPQVVDDMLLFMYTYTFLFNFGNLRLILNPRLKKKTLYLFRNSSCVSVNLIIFFICKLSHLWLKR